MSSDLRLSCGLCPSRRQCFPCWCPILPQPPGFPARLEKSLLGFHDPSFFSALCSLVSLPAGGQQKREGKSAREPLWCLFTALIKAWLEEQTLGRQLAGSPCHPHVAGLSLSSNHRQRGPVCGSLWLFFEGGNLEWRPEVKGSERVWRWWTWGPSWLHVCSLHEHEQVPKPL